MLNRLRWAKVALGKFLEGKVKPSTHHPRREDHQASNDDNNDTHKCHHEPDVILVLGVLLLPLGLSLSELASDLALSGLGTLRGEDRFDELLDLSTDNANLKEVGVLRGVLLVDLARVDPEGVAKDTEVLSRLVHKITSVTLGDLDVFLEDFGVTEAQFHGGNSHGLRDGTEVENTLLAQTSQVEETFLGVLKGVQNHLGVTVESGIKVLRLEEVLEVVDVLRPNLLGPESAVIVEVLPDVADNVSLLEEKSHGLVESGALQKSGVAKFGLHKEAGETLANQASNVVAVQVVLLLGLDTGIIVLGLDRVVGHSIAHLVGDVLDNGLIFGLHVDEFGDDVVEPNQQITVLLLRSVAGECPALLCQNILEIPKKGFLRRQGNRSVILDGVKSTQD